MLGEFCTSYIFNKQKCSLWEGCAANAALRLFLGRHLSAHLQLLQSGTNIPSQCTNFKNVNVLVLILMSSGQVLL